MILIDGYVRSGQDDNDHHFVVPFLTQLCVVALNFYFSSAPLP